MNRTITTFYEFCYLSSVNKCLYNKVKMNVDILNYLKSYSKKDAEELNKYFIYKEEKRLSRSDLRLYFNNYLTIWKLINKNNIRAVSCVFCNNYNEICYGLGYRYNNRVHESEYYFFEEIKLLSNKQLNELNVVKINSFNKASKKVEIFNIEDFNFLSNLRQ